MKTYVFYPEMLTPYDPRHVPLVPPTEQIDDPPYVRVCINSAWASHVDGVLERLNYRDAWLGDDEEVHTALLQVRALMGMLGNVGDACMVEDVILDGCILKIQVDGVVTEVGDLSECGAVGPQGEQGEKGDTGDSGISGADGTNSADSATYTNLDSSGDTPDDNITCGIAQFVGGRINDIMEDNIARIQDFGGIGVTIFGVVDAIEVAIATSLVDLGIISVGFAAGAVPVAVAALAAFILSVGINAINDAFNNAAKQDVIANLYCALDGGMTINQDIVNAWKSLNASTESLSSIKDFINNTIDAVGIQAIVKLAGYGSVNPSNECVEFDCADEWCYTFDLTLSDGGWLAGSSYDPVWTPSVGWQTSTIGIFINLTFPDGANLTYFKIHNVTDGALIDDCGAEQFGVESRVIGGGSTQWYLSCNEANNGVTDVEYTSPFTIAAGDQLEIGLLNINSTTWAISRVELHGTGTNPFGSDNCEE